MTFHCFIRSHIFHAKIKNTVLKQNWQNCVILAKHQVEKKWKKFKKNFFFHHYRTGYTCSST